jgi:hypothetical protein
VAEVVDPQAAELLVEQVEAAPQTLLEPQILAVEEEALLVTK